ncbi:MAG: aminomethyl-transferring glycine dehydrogenase subunit GcvPA [Thermococci archaeon]|nr:aminomethyl-transferring glycine dehydrogenase subunit GcvPA [Thermococci archaeon]
MARHYIPNHPHIEEMLKDIELSSIDDLFSDVPEGVTSELNLPDGMSEFEVFMDMNRTLSTNRTALDMPSFLGAGTYFHHVPAHVKHLIERSEFLTSYTPYQPEISQGILQALFEYQSMMAELVGLPIVNSSMYDWGTALAEAALMVARLFRGRRKKIVVPRHMNPDRRRVLETYTRGAGLEIVEVPWSGDGTMDVEKLKEAAEGAAGVYAEVPNFFGILNGSIRDIGEVAHDAGAYFIVGVDPTVLGIVEAPGNLGADVVVGEASYFGNPMNFGGPRAGIFAIKDDRKMLRQMPGRIIGMTKDSEGRRTFVMTLQTREQHIRRAKATSNICSNEALVAIAAAIHVASLGPRGIRELGEVILKNTEYFKRRVGDVVEVPFRAVNFKDVPLRFGVPYAEVHERLLNRGMHGGYYLGHAFPELGETAMFAVTETTRREWVDKLVEALREVALRD